MSLRICKLNQNYALGHLSGSVVRGRLGEAATRRDRNRGPWESYGSLSLLGISENREAGTGVRDSKEAEPAGLRVNEVGGKEREHIHKPESLTLRLATSHVYFL